MCIVKFYPEFPDSEVRVHGKSPTSQSSFTELLALPSLRAGVQQSVLVIDVSAITTYAISLSSGLFTASFVVASSAYLPNLVHPKD